MELSYRIMWKSYGLSIFKSILPLFFEPIKPCLPSGITFSALQFQRPPSTYTINKPLNYLVEVIDGSYDYLQLPSIRDSCHSHIIPCTEGPLPIPVNNLTAHSLIIEIPPKIYRLKVQNKYIPLDYGTKIDGGIFDYTHFGKSIFKPTIDWNNHKCTDIITYSE